MCSYQQYIVICSVVRYITVLNSVVQYIAVIIGIYPLHPSLIRWYESKYVVAELLGFPQSVNTA